MKTNYTSANRFDRLARGGRSLLACYFPLADPLVGDAVRDAYAEGGADILELGVPTPNPHLDGPDVAETMKRALLGSIDHLSRIERTTEWSRADPARPATICMAYPDLDFESFEHSGVLKGLDGLLLLGLEARDDFHAIIVSLQMSDVRRIGFIPAKFSEKHIRAAQDCNGYIMLQAAEGVTGPRDVVDRANKNKIADLKASGIKAPILLGFGISSPDQAREARDLGADGVVIGSQCVRKALEGPEILRDFVGDVRRHLDD